MHGMHFFTYLIFIIFIFFFLHLNALNSKVYCYFSIGYELIHLIARFPYKKENQKEERNNPQHTIYI